MSEPRSYYRGRVRVIYRSRWRKVLAYLRGRRDMFWHDWHEQI